MKIRSFYLILLALSSFHMCAFADVNQAPIAVEELGATSTQGPLATVVDVTKPNIPNNAFYDFKTISSAQTEPVVHDFVLRNTTNSQLNIEELRISCDCVTATIANQTLGDYKPIESGQDVTVRVSIAPKNLYPGKVNKVVWIFLAGHEKSPAFTLQMNGEIAAPVNFEPQLVDFGDTPLKSIKKGVLKKLVVTTDTAVYGQKTLEPVSTKGFVKIKRDASPVKIVGATIIRSYDVTLTSKVEIGILDDVISLPQTDGTKGISPSIAVTGNIIAQLPKTVPGAKEAEQLPRAEDDRLASIGLPLPTVQVGQSAPDFSVVDCNGKRWNLRNLRGARNVLLTFFPKCFTGGCANHLSSLRDHQSEIALSQTQVIAVSVDPAEGEKGQKAFAERWSFDFPLIPDTSRALCKLYGAVQNDDERAARMTFIIDKRGIVRYIDTNVMVRTHGADMVDKIRELGLK